MSNQNQYPMKKIIVLFIFAFIAQATFAQGVKWGPRVGISTTQVEPQQLVVTNQDGVDSISIALKDAKYGYDGGLFLRFETKKKFFLQTELYFSSKTVEYSLVDLNNTTPSEIIAAEQYYNLNLPVLFGMKYGKNILNFRIQGGPILSKTFGGNTEISDVIDDYKQIYKNLNVGWQAGIGFDIWKFTIDARYEGDFGNFADHMQFFGEDVEFNDRARQLNFSLGFKF